MTLPKGFGGGGGFDAGGDTSAPEPPGELESVAGEDMPDTSVGGQPSV